MPRSRDQYGRFAASGHARGREARYVILRDTHSAAGSPTYKVLDRTTSTFLIGFRSFEAAELATRRAARTGRLEHPGYGREKGGYIVLHAGPSGTVPFGEYGSAPEAMAEADRLAAHAAAMRNVQGFRYPVVTESGKQIYVGTSGHGRSRSPSRAVRRAGGR